MTGSEWLEKNRRQLIDCPAGAKITIAACEKRRARLLEPIRFSDGQTPLNDFICQTCKYFQMLEVNPREVHSRLSQRS